MQRLLAFLALAALAHADTDYQLTDDSKPHEGVPKGELIKFQFDQSKIFPGTTRDVTIYVPKQYDPAKPACVYVNQDGVQWHAPTVFDNLIAKGELPVMIGVFVMHGRVKAADGEQALDRFNRSLEYDGLGPDYAKFVLNELLPTVEQKTTEDGRKIVLSKSGNDRAIGGSSSGAVCAFTAAWERPDAFTRVFSTIGTFVSLRGADRYPGLIRKYEPKPIRIYQQDGSNDQNIYGGDWWESNQMMERALTFAGYEHTHEWGDNGHSGKQGEMLFPEAMRYLWKGWPEPVKAGPSKNAMLNDILIPGEGWQLVGEGYQAAAGAAANAKGEVFFDDYFAKKTFKVALDGKITPVIGDAHNLESHGFPRSKGNQHFGPDGRRYVMCDDEKIRAYDDKEVESVIAEGFKGADLVVAQNGNIYATDPFYANESKGLASRIWLIKPSGEKQIVQYGFVRFPRGVALSPDQTLLYVADSYSHWVYSSQIQPDGTLADWQRYYWLHEPDDADNAGAGGMCVDRDGRLYVATSLGIQVCDQAGRVNVIIPTSNGRVGNLAFGGPDFDILYATCVDKVYKRKVKPHGALSYQAPIKPKAPGL